MVGDEFKRLALQLQSVTANVRQAFTVYADQHKRITEQFQANSEIYTQSVSDVVMQTVASFAEMQKSIEPFTQQIVRVFQELPERNQKTLRIFAENGWYLDPELSLPELFEVAELFEVGEAESAHQKLCDHFEARLDDIQHNICNRFLTRSRVLEAAFGAHRRGEYALSILAFLSQADGICYELVGTQLYARRDGVPMLAKKLLFSDVSPFQTSLLCPLVEPFPISAGSTERSSQPDTFYRHSIVHGEAVDYDTKLNSCRSISLLVYVCWILDEQLHISI